jgi:membrane protease YdiL (CAAX protease family)
LFQAGFDLWMYNMYDSYRDAKPESGNTTDYNLWQNWVGAFNPKNFLDPYGAPIVSVGFTLGALGRFRGAHPIQPAEYSLVGLGEEGLFRGFLFPAFSDLFGSKFVGGFVSSALFSLAHATGGKQNLTGIALGSRFVFGTLFALQTHRNKYDLRPSIFAHTWWDVFVDASGKIKGVGGRMQIPF